MFLLLLLTYTLYKKLTIVTVTIGLIRNLHSIKHLLSRPQLSSKSLPINHPKLREHKVIMVLNRPLKCSQKVAIMFYKQSPNDPSGYIMPMFH